MTDASVNSLVKIVTKNRIFFISTSDNRFYCVFQLKLPSSDPNVCQQSVNVREKSETKNNDISRLMW